MKNKDKHKKINKNGNLWDKYYKKEQRSIKTPDVSLYDYLLQCSLNNRTEIATNYFNSKLIFKELIKKIDVCAKALSSQGVRKGDVVTICLPNTPEAVISFYAVNKIGAIANMVHPLSAQEEIKFSLNSNNSVFLIAIDLSYSKIKHIINDTKVYKTIIVKASDSMPPLLTIGYNLLKGLKIEKPKKSEEFMYWDDFMERGKKYRTTIHEKMGKDDDAVILHSGGTTGTPKNIVLSNGNVNSVIEQGRIIFPSISVGDRFLSVLPMFHCFGLVVCIHAPLCLGATAILIPQFDAKRFDKLITKYNPTIIPGVPTLFEALVKNKHMDKVDMSDVKYVISGGDTLTVSKNEIVNKFLRNHNCKSSLQQGYGMTETTGPVCFGALGSDKLGSVGIPLPGNKIKIVDPVTGNTLKPGETGEICISGPVVMKGYLNSLEKTNNIVKVEDGNRWVHTGDLGYMDSDGVVFFVQRLKRMLIVSGYNVYPSHIEDVIMEHEAVETCGVIGIDHPYKVQEPKAYIVLKPSFEDNFEIKESIRAYCEKMLAKYMVPKRFEFRKSLPKTMIGKINYKELENE